MESPSLSNPTRNCRRAVQSADQTTNDVISEKLNQLIDDPRVAPRVDVVEEAREEQEQIAT